MFLKGGFVELSVETSGSLWNLGIDWQMENVHSATSKCNETQDYPD